MTLEKKWLVKELAKPMSKIETFSISHVLTSSNIANDIYVLIPTKFLFTNPFSTVNYTTMLIPTAKTRREIQEAEIQEDEGVLLYFTAAEEVEPRVGWDCER